MNRLEGRTAIVTGAARGIGRAIARRRAAEGARVAVNDKTSEAAAKERVEEIGAGGGQAFAAQANVCDVAESRGLVRRVLDVWGRLDILVNNAGITRDRSLRKLTDEDWLTVIDNNLHSVYLWRSATERRHLRAPLNTEERPWQTRV